MGTASTKEMKKDTKHFQFVSKAIGGVRNSSAFFKVPEPAFWKAENLRTCESKLDSLKIFPDDKALHATYII